MTRVARISISPVKGFRLSHPEGVELGPDGVAENRRFFLIGPDGERLRSSLTAWPVLVRADYDPEAELHGRAVEGPWGEPLSKLAGHPVRLVRADRVGDGLHAPVTLVSDGSLDRLAHQAGLAEIDSRRFRMLFELTGCEAHEEDAWDGRRLAIGEAVVRVGGPVDRCAVTTRDPDTGERDLDTLRLIKDYRGQRESDGAILFGVYGSVVHPGRVRVGDPFEPLD